MAYQDLPTRSENDEPCGFCGFYEVEHTEGDGCPGFHTKKQIEALAIAALKLNIKAEVKN